MYEDLEISTEDNGEIVLKEDSSANSPAAKWFAPQRQPLRSPSGKHWNKSKRNEFGNETTTSIDACSSGESSSRESNSKSISPTAQQPPPARPIQRTNIEKKQEAIAGTPIPNKTENSNVKSSGANNDTNPMRRASKAKEESPAQVAPETNSADIIASPEQSASPLVTPTNPHRQLKSALSSGSNKVSMQNIYEKPLSYKYLPLELASATTVKNSIAKNILFQSLGHGLVVIKYGNFIIYNLS